MDSWADYAIVSSLGALVGVAEILSRYRDAPFQALKNLPAIVYVVTKLLAAAFALWLIRALGWTVLAQGAAEEAIRVSQILVAAFGAAALFRTGLTVSVGEGEVKLAFEQAVRPLLDAADQAVDRVRAGQRARVVDAVMREVAFEEARVALPTICFLLLKHPPEGAQEEVGQQVRALDESDLSDPVKYLALGLLLLDVAGEDVLERAVEMWKAKQVKDT